MDIEKLLEALEAAATQWGMKGIGVLLAVLAGWAVANSVSNRLRRALEARNFDLTLTRFFANLVRYSILVSVGVACLGVFGVQTISFAGLIAAAGLAIGLALQGTLTNFASGVMLLIFRPFKGGRPREGGRRGRRGGGHRPLHLRVQVVRQPPADRAQQRHLRRHHRQRHALPRAARGREHQQPLRRRPRRHARGPREGGRPGARGAARARSTGVPGRPRGQHGELAAAPLVHARGLLGRVPRHHP
ncbi:MAG: mechanosensitive ion channel [Sandaracinaceae bacterium]|nr:mechanosensitive ion channel [Sandaracinaceae bacterium]